MKYLAIAALAVSLSACSASQIASVDSFITSLESVISTATADAIAACKAAPPVVSQINTDVGLPAAPPYTAIQQDLVTAEAAVTTICQEAAPAAATVIGALTAIEAAASKVGMRRMREHRHDS